MIQKNKLCWRIGWILALIVSLTSGLMVVLSTSSNNAFLVYSYFLDVILFDLLAILFFNIPKIGAYTIISYCVMRLLLDALFKNEIHACVLFILLLIYVVISVLAKKPEPIQSSL